MHRTGLCVLVVLAMSGSHAWAKTWYVPSGESPTIAFASNAAAEGDTIIVSQGTYTYDVIGTYGKNLVFLASGEVILDGSGANAVAAFGNVDRSTVLRGFVIQNGYELLGAGIAIGGSPTIADCIIRNNVATAGGGGIYVAYGAPRISNCIIEGNTAPDGAGILVAGGDFTDTIEIRGNVVKDNVATGTGGGVQCRDASSRVLLENNIISGNVAFRGAGIATLDARAIVTRNTIAGNVALQGAGIYSGGWDRIDYNLVLQNQAVSDPAWGDSAIGGGFFLNDPNQTSKLNNNLWKQNHSDSIGGGLALRYGGATITNDIIVENLTEFEGGGLHVYFASATLKNSVVRGNVAASSAQIYNYGSPAAAATVPVSYCDVEGGWPGLGNVDVDPLFRDPAGDDYHLMSTACGDAFDSPLIDAGDPAASDSLLDCDHGLGGLRADMGAYGGSNRGAPTAVGPEDGFEPALPDAPVLARNLPNPFNASTAIEFTLPRPGRVELTVYNTLGRFVRLLSATEMSVGRHRVMWDGCDWGGRPVPSGVYLYRIETGGSAAHRKMLLLK